MNNVTHSFNCITLILLKAPIFVFSLFKFSIMGNLLYLVAVVLIVLWLVGFVGGYASGGLIHILLVIAVIAILLRVISGRRVL